MHNELARLAGALAMSLSSAVLAQHFDAEAMARAFPPGGAEAPKALDATAQQARDLVAKSLGDDARDLVFIPVTPCTVWDTRFATDPNSMGVVANAVTKRFYTHLDGAGGSYASWGGNPSCPETAENSIGVRPFAAMMTAYVNDATANGWVTFYRDGDSDPSLATISVYYAPGPTRTQTVIAKSSRGYGTGAYDVAVTSRFASANVSASVVGYFVKTTSMVNLALPNSTATAGNILKGSVRFLHNPGDNNLFLGSGSGNFALTGAHNVGMGPGAGASFFGGSQNVMLGADTLRWATDATYNVAVGYDALYTTTIGYANTAVGAYSMYAATTGQYNVGIGADSLLRLTTGQGNVAIGRGAGEQVVTGNGNILIGHGGTSNENNTLRIGDSGFPNRAFISGIRGVTTAISNGVPVLIDSNGQLGTASSSREVKDHIADMDRASDGLMKLRPVTFHYKAHGEAASPQYGLIAEEVEQVYPDLVAKTHDGKAETVMYQFLPPMLLNEYQKQQKRIEQLERERDAQAAEMAALKAAVARLERAGK